MKTVRVFDILNDNGDQLNDISIDVENNFSYMDVFDKVQSFYFDEIDSYSYSVVE